MFGHFLFSDIFCSFIPGDHSVAFQNNTEAIYIKEHLVQNLNWKMKRKVTLNHTYTLLLILPEICCIYYCKDFPKHIS